MTAPDAARLADVPREWVEAICATRAFAAGTAFGVPADAHEDFARRILAAVLPLIAAERDRAVRDALDEAERRIDAARIEHTEGIGNPTGAIYRTAMDRASRIVAELRDGGAR